MKTYHKYIWTFLITIAIFLGVTTISNYFDGRRMNEIRSIEDGISLNILSSETQFDLLRETPCEDLGRDPSLSKELDSLGSRLSFLEDTRGSNDSEVIRLKQDYSLLEIKDYILMNTMAEKCHTKPTFILYFYTNTGECKQCTDTGIVLTALREKYPDVRVYSFDYNTQISAIETLENVYNVKAQFPALVIHTKPTYGLKSLSDIEGLMPELATMIASSTSATSTPSAAATTTRKR